MAAGEPNPNCRCNIGTGSPMACPVHGPGNECIINREDIEFKFEVPKDEDAHYNVTEVHFTNPPCSCPGTIGSNPNCEMHKEHSIDTCPGNVNSCNECKEESRRLHDHTRFMSAGADKKFHGILQVSEEMILAGLGIYDENVQIKRIETPFGRNCIQIHITAPDQDVDMGDGSILKLSKVAQGAEVPVVTVTTDEEQIENLRPVRIAPVGDV